MYRRSCLLWSPAIVVTQIQGHLLIACSPPPSPLPSINLTKTTKPHTYQNNTRQQTNKQTKTQGEETGRPPNRHNPQQTRKRVPRGPPARPPARPHLLGQLVRAEEDSVARSLLENHRREPLVAALFERHQPIIYFCAHIGQVRAMITGDRSKQVLRHTHKPIYFPIFTDNIWLVLFTMAPRNDTIADHLQTRQPDHDLRTAADRVGAVSDRYILQYCCRSSTHKTDRSRSTSSSRSCRYGSRSLQHILFAVTRC